MVQIDEFESQFKRALRPQFIFEPPQLGKIVLVQDSEGPDAADWVREVVVPSLRSSTGFTEEIELAALTISEVPPLRSLIEQVVNERASLLVTSRLLGQLEKGEYDTLGSALDVLLQSISCPTLVLPRIVTKWPSSLARVGVVSDTLEENGRLVNLALRFVQDGGSLHLANVESEQTKNRFIHLIERMPDIDTESSQKLIEAQYFHEAQAFQEGVAREMRERSRGISVESTLSFGNGLSTIRGIVEDAGIQLLTVNTREEDHPAMGGLSYSIALTMRDIPLLMA